MNHPESIAITIVGAGTMGRNIALHLLLHGQEVRLSDTRAQALADARPQMRAAVDFMAAQRLPVPVVDWEAGLSLHSDLAAAAARADLVIEAITEDLEAKRALFHTLERHCRLDTVLASNTSGFLPSRLAAGLARPERLLAAHFWNPAHLIPLVELVPHATTEDGVVNWLRTRLECWGKRPVVLQREVPGFLGNRLAFALQREAMDLVQRGVAGPDEIDAVVRYGFGRRVPVSGVFGTADLGGLDVYRAVCESLFPDLCNAGSLPAELVDRVEQGRLGVKTGSGWRCYDKSEAQELQNAVAAELARWALHDLENAEEPGT